jgi:hypothetical protein
MSDVSTRTELARVVHVVDSSGFEAVISRGARDELKPGQRFLVFAYGPEVMDPDSGENLGRIELVRGRGEIIHLQDSMATIRSVEKRSGRPSKRVIRDTSMLGIATGRGQVIEEDWAAEEVLPFRDISVGDLAKPV